MEWSELDTMYHFAQRHGFVFKQHNFIWDQQQPSWMDSLPPDQQKLEATKWISQYGQRYPDTELIDVVNEPLHHPPHYKKRHWAAMDQPDGIGWFGRSLPHANIVLIPSYCLTSTIYWQAETILSGL
jgi:endo-1,4-beta-xylanase